MTMSAQELVRRMPDAFDSEAAADVNAVLLFDLSQPMHIVIDNGACTAHDGQVDDPDVTLTMDDDDFIALMRGELNGMAAFMTGKLRLNGDLTLANRLVRFFDSSKL